MLLVVEPEAELGRERSSGAEPTDGTDPFEPDLPFGEEEGRGEEENDIVEDNAASSTGCEAALNSQEAEGRERVSSDELRSRCAISSPEILIVRVDSPRPEVGLP
jgi:hypothetical protein